MTRCDNKSCPSIGEDGYCKNDKSTSNFTEYIDYLDSTENKDNIFPAAITDRQSMRYLIDYLLGEDWYVVDPIGNEQVNTEAVHAILMKYSRKYRRERKAYIRDVQKGKKPNCPFYKKTT